MLEDTSLPLETGYCRQKEGDRRGTAVEHEAESAVWPSMVSYVPVALSTGIL